MSTLARVRASALAGLGALACFVWLAPARAHAATPTCVPRGTKGGAPPRVDATFPDRAVAGYATPLVVTVRHGAGERVLPLAPDLATEDVKKSLRAAGFGVVEEDGGSGPAVETSPATAAGEVTSTVRLTIVPLPDAAGVVATVLPPLPVALVRASGEVATACTEPRPVVVTDPTANEPEAAPHGNPAPRVQREPWEALDRAALALGVLALLAAAAFALARRLARRPKAVPPPPPPRPPWEVALEALEQLRADARAADATHGATIEHFDRLSDALRRYLGARFDFDGLESTTDETVRELRRRDAAPVLVDEVAAILGRTDLVKFARSPGSSAERDAMLEACVGLVHRTRPRDLPRPAHAPGAPGGAPR